ncbi:MAG: hypothetical protein WCV88_06085, partial [Patescibacteria group bacterium]
MADTKISQLTTLSPVADDDLIVVVDISDTTMAVTGTTKKAVKTELKGNTGATGAAGADGDDAYVYIAYASDSSGTGFTTTFNSALDYIAIKNTTTAIAVPQASDFTGLWKNYKGTTGSAGATGSAGVDGNDAYVYIAYASDSSGTDFTTTFNASLDYIAIKTTTVAIPSPSASDFTGLWKNYKGATGSTGATGAAGVVQTIGITTANGVSGSSSGGADPRLTVSLGAITPSTVNALTLASQAVGFTIAGGTTSKTLTVPLDASVSGTNTGDQVVPANEAGSANNFLTAYNSTTGAWTKAQPTWANIDKTVSDIGDLNLRSHTSLSDIGSKTHLQIDSFIEVTVPATYQTKLTNSAGLAAALSDETGTGFAVFSTAPNFDTDITFTKEVGHTISVDNSTTTNVVGGDLTLRAGNGNGTNTGGSLIIYAGDGDNLTGTGAGGEVSITGGSGGGVTGAGGGVQVFGGGASVEGAGGTLEIGGGDANGVGNNDGGNIYFYSGVPTGAGANGRFRFFEPTALFSGDLDFTSINTSDKTFTFQNQTGTVGLLQNKLSEFAATTSAELAGVISDETGSGALVFGTAPTFTTNISVPIVKPTADSTTAIQINKADGTTNVLNVDTT